jgi:hypothetical protein
MVLYVFLGCYVVLCVGPHLLENNTLFLAKDDLLPALRMTLETTLFLAKDDLMNLCPPFGIMFGLIGENDPKFTSVLPVGLEGVALGAMEMVLQEVGTAAMAGVGPARWRRAGWRQELSGRSRVYAKVLEAFRCLPRDHTPSTSEFTVTLADS